MHIDRVIPKFRFEKEYLTRFFQSNGRARYYVRMLKYKSWQRPIITPLYMVNDLLKLVKHEIKYWSLFNRDLVPACEKEL